ncbi:MAG: hypothetical protein JRI68_19585 [Deltaproteobacteria bacterium]|nr:hypothetical protein [Deltaproteobacteria bacterium]
MGIARCGVGAAALAVLTAAQPAAAIVLSEDEIEDESTEIGAVARSFAFVMTGDVLEPPQAFEDTNPLGMGFFDARLYFTHRTPDLKLVVHNQFTLQMQSAASSGLQGLGRAVSPPRWLPLGYSLDKPEDAPTLGLRTDADWLYAAYTAGPVTVTVGRQPVSIGRGQLWTTSDRISMFSFTEVDKAYKPGVDALRLDYAPAERTNLMIIAAIGELESQEHDAEVDLRGSSFLGQLKQGWEWGEAGLLGGMVRADGIAGLDAVLDLGELSLHGEVTATFLSDDSLSSPAIEDRDVPVFEALVGATLRPADTLTLIPEVLYNGFGAWGAEDYLPIALSQRMDVGEQQGFGKLYAGMHTDWEVEPLTHLFSAMLANVHDPSALALLGLRHNLSANVDGVLGAYAPIGYEPDTQALTELGTPPYSVQVPTPRSEFGSYPYFVFFELKGVL